MQLSTKQVFLTGLLAWVASGFAGYKVYIQQSENQSVRMKQLEKEVEELKPLKLQVALLVGKAERHSKKIDSHTQLMQKLAKQMQQNREGSIRVVEALNRVAETQKDVVRVTESLQLIVTRLETIESLKEK